MIRWFSPHPLKSCWSLTQYKGWDLDHNALVIRYITKKILFISVICNFWPHLKNFRGERGQLTPLTRPSRAPANEIALIIPVIIIESQWRWHFWGRHIQAAGHYVNHLSFWQTATNIACTRHTKSDILEGTQSDTVQASPGCGAVNEVRAPVPFLYPASTVGARASV